MIEPFRERRFDPVCALIRLRLVREERFVPVLVLVVPFSSVRNGIRSQGEQTTK